MDTSEFRVDPELDRKEAVFQSITSKWTAEAGKKLSLAERNEAGYKATPLVYGEVDFRSLGEVFNLVNSKHFPLPSHGVFYDLGAGTGKGVIAAALLHNFARCKGIELLTGLHSASLDLKAEYERHFSQEGGMPAVDFIQGDFFEVDWSDVDLLFVNATCFNPEMMRRIGELVPRQGVAAITVTEPIPQWPCIDTLSKQMTWGQGTVYIQVKT